MTCTDCQTLANMIVRQAEEQVQQTVEVLKESVRVALVTGALQGQSIPQEGSTGAPTAAEVRRVLEKLFKPAVDSP